MPGPPPKRQRRRRNAPSSLPVQVVGYRTCNRDGCSAVVGQVRHDPAGRWCMHGHGQHADTPDGRQSWHPEPM